MNDILKLNVGGGHFMTTRATLCAEEDSMLAKMFDPASPFGTRKEVDGEIFIDRSSQTFHHVLEYLRNGCRLVSKVPNEVVEILRADADYFGLEKLKIACDEGLSEPKEAPRPKESKMKYKFELATSLERLVYYLNCGYEVDSEHIEAGTRKFVMRKKA